MNIQQIYANYEAISVSLKEEHNKYLMGYTTNFGFYELYDVNLGVLL
jgi:hypothetical protein